MRLKSAAMAFALIALGAMLGGGTATAERLITGKQIKDRSVMLKDLALAARPRAGVPGPQGGLSKIQVVQSAPVPYGPISAGAGAVAGAVAKCPTGTTLVGGGYTHAPDGATSISLTVGHNAPASPDTWGVIVINNFDVGDELIAVAQCAVGSGPAPRSLRAAAADARGFAARLAAFRSRAG